MAKKMLLSLLFVLAVVSSEPDCSDEDIGMVLCHKVACPFRVNFGQFLNKSANTVVFLLDNLLFHIIGWEDHQKFDLNQRSRSTY